MQQTDVIFHLQQQNAATSISDLHESLSALPEQLLTQANSATTSTIILNCSELDVGPFVDNRLGVGAACHSAAPDRVDRARGGGALCRDSNCRHSRYRDTHCARTCADESGDTLEQ